MSLEIERKFLVRDESYKAMASSHSRIVQGYICSGQGRTVRVRLKTTHIGRPTTGNAQQTADHTAEVSLPSLSGTGCQGAAGCSGGEKLSALNCQQQTDSAYLTIKGPSHNNGLTRYEFEKEITIDEGLSLLTLCEPGKIDKVRWLVPMPDGHTFEVDEFFGENAGLTVAEVELGSEDEAFLRPEFLGEEVTGDRRYYNSQLRRVPFTQW